MRKVIFLFMFWCFCTAICNATMRKVDGVVVEEIPFVLDFNWNLDGFNPAEAAPEMFCYEVGYCYVFIAKNSQKNFVLANGWTDGVSTSWNLLLIQQEDFIGGYWYEISKTFYVDYQGNCDT